METHLAVRNNSILQPAGPGNRACWRTMRDERDGMVQDLDGSAEIVLKILLVGAPKSGKTSLVRRLCDKAFRETYLATLGFDVTVVPYATYQGRPVKLHLWDVAGSQLNAHPCHHALIGDGAEGVMYVMDVTNRESLQAVDDWDRALSNFLPPWVCKLLVGHKADLPAYVVNDEALSLYVASASGFCGWCLTVGSSEYGDYDVAARRGGGGSTADVGGRYKGQSLSGEKQLSVSEAVRTLVGHVFRAGGAGGNGARPAGVVGTGASPGGAAPYPSRDLDDALETVGLLGLGSGPLPIRRASDDPVATTAQREYLEGDRRGEGRGGGEGGASDMPQLLRRGRGPDPSWTAGAGILADGHTASSDPGWDYFAGRMEREEAEKLLRGRPDGTFFLRRKGPSLLVLTYVAKVPGTQGGGRKSSGTLSPRRTLASPQDDSSRRGVFKGGGGIGVGDRGGSDVEEGAGDDDPAESGSVQHALLVHEGGFFSDEKGRLGCFPTLDELLKSKIKALARHPLTFRREGNRYVLVDPEAKTPDNSLKSAPIDRRHSPTSDWSSGLPPHSPAPSPSTPFARPDDATNLARGTIAASRAPVVSSNIFDGRHDDVATAGAAATVPAAMETAAVAAVAADAERLSPPPHSPLSAPPTGSSPSVDTGALYESSLRGRRSRIGSRSSSKSASYNWADKRADKTKHPMGGGVEGRGRGGDAASSGGFLWMQAAAAVENKSTASGSSGRRLGKSGNTSDKSRGLDSLSGGGGGGGTVASTGYGTGKVSPGSGGSSLQSGSAWGRRRPGKGSASSTDDGDSVSSSSLAEGADADLRGAQQQQHRWGVEASVMAAAAEEVAALNAAKDHPEAKRTEDRMLAAQAKVNNALTALERRLVSLVTRQAPMPSPRPSARPPEVRARRGFSSTYSSPRGSRSPCAPSLGEELQPQRWVAVAPTGATVVTAPLAAAAALLMERAWSFRKELLASVDKLRERSVALAVAEASGAAAAAGGGGGGGGGGITAVASAAVASAAMAGAAIGSAPVVGGDWLPAQGNQSPPLLAAARRFPLSDRQVFAADMGEVRRGLRVEGLRGEATESMVGEVADSLTLHPAADTGREEPGAAAAAAAALGGVLGVSCCLDFDRILGDDSVLAGSAEGLPGNGQSEEVVGSPLSPEADSIDRLGPVSGGGVVTDGLLLGFGRTAIQSGDGGCVSGMSARERRHCSDPPRVGSLAPDAWPLVLRDVSAVEERCREYVSAWESAGGALGEACEDLGGDDVRGLTGFFAAQ